MCGEQLSSVFACWIIWGSPPRVRGTADPNLKATSSGRITPACAGNSVCIGKETAIRKDHPRVCGEQAASIAADPADRGSPPRVRGTGRYSRGGGDFMRITPACAGNSFPMHTVEFIPQDHPRVCGEQPMAGTRGRQRQGSPPRVRGTEIFHQLRGWRHGITPACAGNSRRRK